MAILLRQNEEIKIESDFHWSTFIKPVVIMALAVFFSIGATSLGKGNIAPFILLLGFSPFAYLWLNNKCKKYVVTNERVYIELGVLSKLKKDVSLKKISEVNVTQSLLQRLFGSGSIVIYTGNDKPIVLVDLENPEQFREVISTNLTT